MRDKDRIGRDDQRTGVVVKSKPKTKKPSMYKVLLLNDDYTPMEFVVHVLERFFAKSREEATRIMLHVHRRGVGICGVFTYEVAETKVAQVIDFARRHEHPLQGTLEKDEAVDAIAPIGTNSASRPRRRQRASPRICDARASAACPHRGPGCRGRLPRLQPRSRPPAPRSLRIH